MATTPSDPTAVDHVRAWSWVLVWMGLGVAGSVDGLGLSRAHAWSVAGLIGVVLGVNWQWFNRRDVAHRLGLMSMVFLLCIPLAWVPGVEANFDAWGMSVMGLIAGVVLAELTLQKREAGQAGPGRPTRGPSGSDDIFDHRHERA